MQPHKCPKIEKIRQDFNEIYQPESVPIDQYNELSQQYEDLVEDYDELEAEAETKEWTLQNEHTEELTTLQDIIDVLEDKLFWAKRALRIMYNTAVDETKEIIKDAFDDMNEEIGE